MPTPARPSSRAASRPAARRPAARRKPAATPKGLVRLVAHLEAPQLAALQHEAQRRKRRPADVSEVLREAVSVWMSIRPAQRALIRAVAARQELTRPEVLRGAIDVWLTSLDPRKF